MIQIQIQIISSIWRGQKGDMKAKRNTYQAETKIFQPGGNYMAGIPV